MRTHGPVILRNLDGGLVMRQAIPEDADALASFNGSIHGDDPQDAQAVSSWTRDLLTKPHPNFQPGDFLIVEDPAKGKIVSSLCTISQQWKYETIPFGVGRPELVGTDPEYRNRGLVRAQFEVIHEWSRQRGELVQVITGIPYYYRQYGYEMALDLSGGRAGYEPNLPVLEEGKEEKYRFRPAREADLPWLAEMYQRECSHSMVSAVRDLECLRYELLEQSNDNVNRVEMRVIETSDGQAIGYLVHPWYVWNTMQVASRYELVEGISYLEVTPAVIRYLWKTGIDNAKIRGKKLLSFGFWFGIDHPAYHAVPTRLVLKRDPYAFYIRVPDLPAFLRHIAPVLEKRISESSYAGHTGELKISFYRDGLRMVFENGALRSVEKWQPAIQKDEGAAAFPNLTFLQLVFGYRSLDEIRHAFADCYANEEAQVILGTLFPKKPSNVWCIS